MMKIRPLKNKQVQLENDGQLSIYFVGVGSAFAQNHTQTNLLIIKGKDHLLVDCGTKCFPSLYEVGITTAHIQNIFLTHSHADHIGGVEELALMSRYLLKRKPHLYITPVYEKILWEHSLKGGCAFSETNGGRYLGIKDYFEIHHPRQLRVFTRDTFEFEVGSINIKAMRTLHIPEDAPTWKQAMWSTGLVIDDKVFFSGDTKYDEDLILDYEDRFRFEILFQDAQFFTGGVHASINELDQLPPEIKMKMVLVHLSDNWTKFEDRVKELGFHGFARSGLYYDFFD